MSVIADSSNVVQGTAVVIRESAKCKELNKSKSSCDDVINILAICPTRWRMRTVAAKRVCCAYREITRTLKELKDDKSVRGHQSQDQIPL